MIAITGGSGPLAGFLIPELIRQGKSLRVLSEQRPLFSHERLQWVKGNVFDIPVLEDLLQGADKVYHLERVESYRRSERLSMYRTNIEGTANVVNVARVMQVSRFLFTSTIYSLGDKCESRPFDETAKWSDTRSASGFGWSMHLAEREVWRGVSEGLPAMIVHLPVVTWPPGTQGKCPGILDWCLRMDRSYPSGNIHFIDPESLIRIITGLMDSDISNEAFIAYSGRLSFKELITTFNRISGQSPPSKAISYLSLSQRVIHRILNVLARQHKPRMTLSLAGALADARVFSNQKLLQAIRPEMTDDEAVLERFWSQCHSEL